MIDPAFIKYVQEGSKMIISIAEALPRQFDSMKKDISEEGQRKINDAIKFSDIKGKVAELRKVRKDLDDTINKRD